MNVNGIHSGQYPVTWSPVQKEVKPEQEQVGDVLEIQTADRKGIKLKNEHGADELVMKPSPVSAEERLSQVISPEQMKDLLSMIVSSRFSSVSEMKTGRGKIDLKG
ncbi:hypothetical protein CH352_06235 [Leptospira hartskeerlii]|uniref:Uncharacterized protein n=1 Tax=Leptospira hartskeerlii TaxID=2023177 RepID=A0A2M9XEW6_9LEPT|nr:hypothetical protein [Leptospira hartskeerlii]PJZ26174.1 hypothetical protein CH357_06640 [Leptospira hartskeerlii]PJZ34258.1 hypothetical protein CH352_06235 [Leptospira hartskeerlii]